MIDVGGAATSGVEGVWPGVDTVTKKRAFSTGNRDLRHGDVQARHRVCERHLRLRREVLHDEVVSLDPAPTPANGGERNRATNFDR